MADNTLVQSGKTLYDQQAQLAGTGDAFQEGKKLITDQMDKNIKDGRDKEKHDLEITKLKQEEELREMGLEEKLMMKEQQNLERKHLISEGVKSGAIQPTDYDGWQLQGDSWLQDIGNQMKVLTDAGGQKKLQGRMNTHADTKTNAQNIFGFAQSATPGADFPQHQELDFALEALAESGRSHGYETVDGIDYVVVPNPNGEDIKIPAETWASAKSFDDLLGPSEEAKSFSTSLADWSGSNKKVLEKLSKGVGTASDVEGIGNWFLANAKTTGQQQELLDTFFTTSGITPGSEDAQALGIEDTDGDGEITSKDIQIEDFKEVFIGAVAQEYGLDLDNQTGEAIAKDAVDKQLGQGKYAKKPGQGSKLDNTITNAINTSDFTKLQGVPIVNGVKGEYIRTVISPGDTYTSDGEQKKADQYYVVSSKQGAIPVGQDPSQALTTLTGANFLGKPKEEEAPAETPPAGDVVQRNEGESIPDFLARQRGETPKETPLDPVKVEPLSGYDTATYAPESGDNSSVQNLKGKLNSEYLPKIKSVKAKLQSECSVDQSSSTCERYLDAYNYYTKKADKAIKLLNKERGLDATEERDEKIAQQKKNASQAQQIQDIIAS